MDSKALARERRQLREAINLALDEEEDPLAAYDQFVKWTVKNYPQGDPNSGLVELLEEATGKFKDDQSYKGDLRYLKLWCQYARVVEKPAAVYGFLAANNIGTGYAMLYEEYAKCLEQDGRYNNANEIFRLGITRNARPLERLKKRHAEFQARPSSSSSRPASSTSRPKGNTKFDVPRHDPLKNSNGLPQSKPSKPKTALPTSKLQQPIAPTTGSALNYDPYSYITAPPLVGRRPAKLHFDLSLLLTKEGVEYSYQEARAKSMGLLGKKWGPDPVSELASPTSTHSASSSSSSIAVDFNDDDEKTTMLNRRQNRGGFEPTVTINTKEALADVFGMYNSPEKTLKIERPGSKHAPVKKVEPVTPAPFVRPPDKGIGSDKNTFQPSGKTPAFKPFVDENANRKENATPAPKFKPFVDSDTSNKAPFITPDVNRRVLSAKDTIVPTPTPSSVLRSKFSEKSKTGVLQPVPEDSTNHSIFPKVFAPKDFPKDVFSAPSTTPALTFIPPPDPNAKTPFKVFSRPPGQSDNAFTPKSNVFTPLVNDRAGHESEKVPSGRIVLGERTRSWSPEIQEEADGEEEQLEEGQEQYPEETSTEEDIPETQSPEAEPRSIYEEEVEQYRVPLGGRFGQFNVMTPITERTYDFTMSTRGMSTPREEEDAFGSAERLAAELREADEDAEQLGHSGEGNQSSFASHDEEWAEAGNAGQIAALEEKTGTLSLFDTLTMASSFKPSNPCNPFDPAIVSTLLSLIPVNHGFHDLRDQEAKLLDGLQKFAHKQARQSGNTSSRSIVSDTMCYSLTLGDSLYNVLNKLGEGGFGAVFTAKKVKDVDASFTDDEDEDSDEESMVAIKVVKPRNIWEYHILQRVHHSIPQHLRRSVVVPHTLYAYRDESFLLLDLCPQGTLLDIVNRASQAGVSQQGACLDELLVMFFSIELLRLVEGMHQAGFIHGDLKIDNCLLRLEDVPGGAAALSSIYSPTGEQGWSYKGIKLIDFGRTIETGLFPVGQQFLADWSVDAKDCFEMRERRPWTYQADYFGLAGIVYCLLFGKYIETSSITTNTDGTNKRFKISTPFKRYWQGNIWSSLFDVLLNPTFVRSDGQLPLCNELAATRKEMESWLQSNCNRSSGTLKGLLKKIEVSVYSR